MAATALGKPKYIAAWMMTSLISAGLGGEYGAIRLTLDLEARGGGGIPGLKNPQQVMDNTSAAATS
jgi:hypothetical protein